MGGRGASSGYSAGQPNDATEYYVSGDGMYINQLLRRNASLDDFEKNLVRDLDKATQGTVREAELYRSVDAKTIFGNISDIDYENLYGFLSNGESMFDKGAYSQNLLRKTKNIISQALGKTHLEKGFMSTSKSENIASNWGGFSGSSMPIVMRIKGVKGAKGVDLSRYDKKTNSPQKEVLLARNQKYKVNKISFKNGNIYIDATLTRR